MSSLHTPRSLHHLNPRGGHEMSRDHIHIVDAGQISILPGQSDACSAEKNGDRKAEREPARDDFNKEELHQHEKDATIKRVVSSEAFHSHRVALTAT